MTRDDAVTAKETRNSFLSAPAVVRESEKRWVGGLVRTLVLLATAANAVAVKRRNIVSSN